MKKSLLFVALGLTATAVFAQNLSLDWAVQMGGTNTEIGYSITTDDGGNVYITGDFWGISDFDPGPETVNLTPSGISDIFIQKLDAEGNLMWVKKMGGIGRDVGYSIVSDAGGNVYTTGSFNDTVDFDPGIEVLNLISSYSDDVFIQKLDNDGNLLWVKQIGGIYNQFGFSITTDAEENVYITGSFLGTCDFDPGPETLLMTSFGAADIFVEKLDSDGNLLWVKQLGGDGIDQAFSIAVDNAGNVISTGYFFGIADFDPSPTEAMNLISSGQHDVFINSLDPNGNLLWARQIGGDSGNRGLSVTTDISGNVYVSGDFRGTIDLDTDSGIISLTSNGETDIFIQKFDFSGNFLWVRQMGGVGYESGNSITIDTENNVYITGYFSDIVDFNPGAGTANLIAVGSNDIFIQKLDSEGNFIWVGQMGGDSMNRGQSITTDPSGNVYATGYFFGTVDFDPGSETVDISSVGKEDIFVQKFKPVLVGINENSLFDKVIIYPNPTQGIVNINFGQLKDVSITITNIDGKVIHQKSQLNAGNYSFEIHVSKGLYFIEIISNEKRRVFKLNII